MVFGNITTLYFPVAGSAGASQWGTDVRKLLDAPDAGSDSTTINSHGTGTGLTTRTYDPYSTSSADADQTLFGWAITPADMNSVAGARRFYPAGDHVAEFRMHQTGAVSVAVTVTVFVYRVGPAPGRTRTLLGSGSASPTLPALSAHATVNVTVSLPEIIFEADETIQYSIETNTTGVVVTGRNVILWTGTDGGVEVRMDTPVLATTRPIESDLVGAGELSNVRAVTMEDTLTGDGVPTMSKVVVASKSFNLVGDGTITRQLAVAESKDLTGDGVPTTSRTVVAGKTFNLVGDGTLTKDPLTVGIPRDLVGVGEISHARATVVSKTFDLTGDGTLTELHPVQAFRTFDLVGVGELVNNTITLPLDEIPSGDCPSDWTPNDGLKSIAGDVFFHEPPNQGDPVVGAEVCLIRDSDGLRVDCTLTDGAGHYNFPRDTNDPNTYAVEVRYTDIGGDQQGLSEGGCVPS